MAQWYGLISGSGDISTMNEPSVADNNREEFSNDIVSSSSPRQLDISDIDALSDMIDDIIRHHQLHGVKDTVAIH